MSEPGLPEKILAVHDALSRARIDHALVASGARPTMPSRAPPTTSTSISSPRRSPIPSWWRPSSAGCARRARRSRRARGRAVPAVVGAHPARSFFAYDEPHEEMRRAVRLVPFGDRQIPLPPEHLLVCKAIFDRPKDWLDIEQMIVCVEELDEEMIRTWLTRSWEKTRGHSASSSRCRSPEGGGAERRVAGVADWVEEFSAWAWSPPYSSWRVRGLANATLRISRGRFLVHSRFARGGWPDTAACLVHGAARWRARSVRLSSVLALRASRRAASGGECTWSSAPRDSGGARQQGSGRDS